MQVLTLPTPASSIVSHECEPFQVLREALQQFSSLGEPKLKSYKNSLVCCKDYVKFASLKRARGFGCSICIFLLAILLRRVLLFLLFCSSCCVWGVGVVVIVNTVGIVVTVRIVFQCCQNCFLLLSYCSYIAVIVLL